MEPQRRSAWHGYLLVVDGLVPAVRRTTQRGEAAAEFAALHAHLDANATAWGLDGLRLLGIATHAHVMHRRGDQDTSLVLLQALARRLFALSRPGRMVR
ncbi:hypothetical protein [Catellatospora tritici]|uniref:hypothetical protein n=1 Tax=Catellatospora tritici TaxID=2851566 RepID=UPI001C2D398D|nr:hypothetical protein [Catellatospora tritici]MBV1850674.1 hypothetical protein [Catellatospora tritici]MBV1850927.1 hypothetical protein [Catellatospora tritici]